MSVESLRLRPSTPSSAESQHGSGSRRPETFLFHHHQHQNRNTLLGIRNRLKDLRSRIRFMFDSLLIKHVLILGARRIPMLRTYSSVQGCSTAPSVSRSRSDQSLLYPFMTCGGCHLSIHGTCKLLFACELPSSFLLTFWKIFFDDSFLQSLMQMAPFSTLNRPLFHS